MFHRIATSSSLVTLALTALLALPAWAEDTYKFGVSEPLSGAASSLGVPVVDNITLAAKAINDAGGVNGRKIELLIRDDQSRPDVAVQNFRKLIEDGVYGIIGPNQGSNALAVAPAVKEGRVPMCGFNNTISITKLGNPYIFRCQTSDADNVRAALSFARNKLKAQSVAMVYTSDAYGTEAFAAMTAAAAAMHLPIAAASQIDYNATDTTAEWTKVLAAKPGAIILWGSGSTMAVALRNASQLGNTAPIIGSQGIPAAAIIKAAGHAADGVYAVTLTAPDKVTPGQEELVKLYQKKNGPDYQLTIYDTIGWDALHLFVQALRNAGGDKSKMVAGMEQIRNYQGAAGTYTYTADDHDGLGPDSVWIVQIRNGRQFGVQHGLP